MRIHVISNAAISKTLAFFAYLTLIFGVLGAWGFLSRPGLEITPAVAIVAAAIAVGCVFTSFFTLAIARILERVSALK